MAVTLKPEIMNALLGQSNWALATNVADRVFEPEIRFPGPIPVPRPSLLVPVDLQALYVPVSHSERYVRLPMELGGKAGDKQVTPPFTQPRARAKGVHLHWAMPDGLLRGELVDDNDAPVQMRALPDRWLVVRMTGRRNVSRVDLKSWLIESDSGQVFDLDNYPGNPVDALEKGVKPDELTGIIGGSPNWTASYDAALNRFAFHDPLDDLNTALVQTKRASYVVIGWWSERAHDPLSSVYSPYSVHRRISGFGWSASEAPRASEWKSPLLKYDYSKVALQSSERSVDLSSSLKLTTSHAGLAVGFKGYSFDRVTLPKLMFTYETTLHGVVYGVPVSGSVRKDEAPRASKIGLSMAPTLERLMAAQVTKGMGVTSVAKKEYFESLMTAVANASLMNVGSRDGVVALDETEHGDGFEAFQGPETYEDVVVERQQSALKGGRPQRTRAARNASEPAPRADVVWNGRVRGNYNATQAEVRRVANEIIYKKFEPANVESLLEKPVIKRVRRPGPRYHRPTPPVIGLRDYGKSNRFLGDGRFDEDGNLICRWTEELGTDFGPTYRAGHYVPSLNNAAIPDVANRVLQNTYLPDPYLMPWAFSAIESKVKAERVGATQNRLRGEVALRFSQDGIYDGVAPIARGGTEQSLASSTGISDELRRFSLLEGRDPSPVGVTSWVQPWCPVWLEWEIELEPGTGFEGWLLERIEFGGSTVPNGKKVTLQGRSAITSGLARTYSAVIRTYLIAEGQRENGGEISTPHEKALTNLAKFLKKHDLGSVTLDRISDLWLGLENGPDGQVVPAPVAVAGALQNAGLPKLIASGTLRVTRARIIDSFGRFRNLSTSNVTLPAALSSKAMDGKKALAMPPRLSLPARLMWRFVDPADTSPIPREAHLDQAQTQNTINPVSGYILPDFIDESLEFFDQNGMPLGEVLHDPVTGGVVWEGGVGRAGPVSSSPTADLPPSALLCGSIAQGMISADIAQRNIPETEGDESTLSAFLRAVDTTMWSIDSSLASAGATIAGLVGRPIAVVRTQLWLDIPEELSNTGAFGEEADDVRDHLIREAVFDAVKSSAFKVRLGELAKGHDGLYGFFIGDDYDHFHLIEKEVSSTARVSQAGVGYRALLGGVPAQVGANYLPAPSPLNIQYIGAGVPLSVHAGQRMNLTLLMHPSARVHATTGFLPRKSLELVRDWVAPGLGRVAPSARIGPVLIDPDKVRLPKIAAFGANQTWTRRNTPLTWRDDPILAATQAAILPTGRVTVEEGYIRITPDEATDDGSNNGGNP